MCQVKKLYNYFTFTLVSTEFPEGEDSTSQCNFSQAPCLDEWKSLMLTTEESESLFGSQEKDDQDIKYLIL